MTDREACIVLNLIPGIGPIRLRALCDLFGSPTGVLEAGRRALAETPGLGAKLAAEITSWKENVDLAAELAMAERAGVQIISQFDEGYPGLLREIYDPPLCLYVRGKMPSEGLPHLGVVGSRRISNYGRRMAENITEEVVRAGWVVVSGLAYGVDAVAHSKVVELGGPTIAVLGGGLARIHPQDHIPLARQIVAEGGAVISEFPMTFPPSRRTFPMRNRIISGLSRGVLVVEAGTKSGALITARCALEQGRLVFAIPGRVDNPQAQGCHAIIREGACLTESFMDILGEFEFLPGIKSRPMAEASSLLPENDKNAESGLTASNDEHRIMTLLQVEGECTVDELAAATGIAAGKLLALLMELTIRGMIRALPGKRYSLK